VINGSNQIKENENETNTETSPVFT